MFKNKKMMIAAFAMPLALTACAQSGVKNQTATDLPVISADNIKAHMTFLADDAMKGRNAGSSEYIIAANYVATQYKLLGLKPAGNNGSYFQDVKFANMAVDGDLSKFTYTVDGKTVSLEWKDDFVASGNAHQPDMTANSKEVLFIGTGKGVKNADVAGKVIAMIQGSRTNYSKAAAIITLRTKARQKASPFAKLAENYMQSKLQLISPDGKAMGRSRPAQTKVSLSNEASRKFIAASGNKLSELSKSAKLKDFKPMTLKMAVSARTKMKKNSVVNSPNVLGMLEGSDPVLKNEYVIISGHLDHVGEHCRMGLATDKNDSVCNGALDNASGIATMLEAARAFTTRKAPKRSVIFAALTAEEKGLLGAYYYTNYPTVPIKSIVADVNLDMPILTYDFADVVAFGGEHSTIGPIAEKALSKIGVGLAVDPMPEQRLFGRSDHYMFVLKGVPSVFLMSGPNEVGGKPGSGLVKFEEFLNTNYHSKADDMSQPLMFDVAAKFSLANYLIIDALANSTERAMWYEGNEYGDKYAPDASRAKASDAVKARALEAEKVKKERFKVIAERRAKAAKAKKKAAAKK